MTEDDLTPEELEWMEGVPREVEPPPGLRGAVADRLRTAGVLRPERGRPTRHGPTVGRLVAGLSFALVLGVGLGWWGGSRRTEPGAGEPLVAGGQSRFVLMLYEGPEYQALG
jgi:ABC-type nitrate/sulfonate/bicarbonate transport system permease component